MSVVHATSRTVRVQLRPDPHRCIHKRLEEDKLIDIYMYGVTLLAWEEKRSTESPSERNTYFYYYFSIHQYAHSSFMDNKSDS